LALGWLMHNFLSHLIASIHQIPGFGANSLSGRVLGNAALLRVLEAAVLARVLHHLGALCQYMVSHSGLEGRVRVQR